MKKFALLILFSLCHLLYAQTPGTEKWEIKTGGNVSSSPAIGSDGTVYVGSDDHKLYAIYIESAGIANSPWPKFKHDNQNSGKSSYITAIEEQNIKEIPNTFVLYPLYPNPFNPLTRIKFDIPRTVKVEISVYNIAGRCMGKLLNENKKAGTYIVNWDASKMASGMYFIRMKAGNYVKTRKCLLVK